ncbi:NUDIX domain-containing protein [Mobilicoccus massiliensis]|uniref:NUDIX domain-containing protein n=1 Tax=Mobilicoccus massiliensis TaxID=1522310 RepID=UPI00058AF637|nr:NUDIX hydrolase [Mobilicoccus massiliensis]
MFRIPEIPASAGAIILDDEGRLLILKPTYKSGWTVPGGIMEDDGETPWDACRREVREETGLEVTHGRLVCVDTRPAKKGEKLGLRFLFHCGVVSADQAKQIRLQEYEIREHRWAGIDEALELLRPAIRRRVKKGLKTKSCLYLEGGKRVDGVSR